MAIFEHGAEYADEKKSQEKEKEEEKPKDQNDDKPKKRRHHRRKSQCQICIEKKAKKEAQKDHKNHRWEGFPLQGSTCKETSVRCFVF